MDWVKDNFSYSLSTLFAIIFNELLAFIFSFSMHYVQHSAAIDVKRSRPTYVRFSLENVFHIKTFCIYLNKKKHNKGLVAMTGECGGWPRTDLLNTNFLDLYSCCIGHNVYMENCIFYWHAQSTFQPDIYAHAAHSGRLNENFESHWLFKIV